MSPRPEGRASDALRPVRVTRHYLKHAMGSCIFELGDTRVLCAANIDDGRVVVAPRLGPGLGHRRVRDAAGRDAHALAAREHRRAAPRAARRRSSASSAGRCAPWST